MSDCDEMELVERVALPLRAVEPLDASFEARLQSAVRASIARGEVPWMRASAARRRGPRRWLLAPRRIEVSPFVGLAAAACFAAVVAGTTHLLGDRGAAAASLAASGSPTASAREVVHFAIMAPTARTVALVGDFNGWDANATPLRAVSAGPGLWTVTVPLASGTYQYAFVIDGTAWVADPTSGIAVKDEFGASSSLMIVRGGST